MRSEHQGQGGSYLLNPKTGKVSLIERTKPANPPEFLPEELTDEPSVSETPTEGEN